MMAMANHAADITTVAVDRIIATGRAFEGYRVSPNPRIVSI